MNSSKQLPDQLLYRLQKIVNPSQFQNIKDSFSVRKPTTLRANTLKISGADLLNKMRLLGIKLETVAWWDQAFIVINVSLQELTELDLYKDGYFYVQSLSSMIPPLILDPKPGEKVLDITAAPGSKTTQMAALMKNQGNIVANDINHIRLLRLRANLNIQGVTNTTILKEVGQTVWRKYPEYFDKALVDVPCSMEGRISILDPKTYEHWSTAKIRDLVQEQRFILRAAVSATKPGGIIVYSTCTLAPEENEGIIDWILNKEKDAIEVMDIKLPHFIASPAITSWNTKTFNPQLSKTVRILPSPIMEGFYVAKLRKLSSTIPQSLRQ